MIEDLKPSPCVGCGYCCQKAPCEVAVRIYGPVNKCPELKWNGSRYVCRLMTLDGNLGFKYRKEIYANEGCCSSLNSWRKDVKERNLESEEESKVPNIPPMMQRFIGSIAQDPFLISGDAIFLMCNRFKHQLMKLDGWTEDAAHEAMKNVHHIMTENRPSFVKEFMG